MTIDPSIMVEVLAIGKKKFYPMEAIERMVQDGNRVLDNNAYSLLHSNICATTVVKQQRK